MSPKTYLIGYTQVDFDGLMSYLKDTDQEAFGDVFEEATKNGISSGQALCSFYAKLCYKSLVTGKNANITGVRDIESNITGCFDTGHGSVFEHCWLNFITTDCSRIFTHELVRHRVGTAFSQTSGRYVALDEIKMVLPPELQTGEEVTDRLIQNTISDLGTRTVDSVKYLRELLIERGDVCPECEGDVQNYIETTVPIPDTCPECQGVGRVPIKDFTRKKKITSAIRRFAPNGQVNEIGWSCNIRSLRHMLEMRTSRHAEWEIRVVFNQVSDIIEERFPLMLYGGKCTTVDGLKEWTGLKV